MSTTADIGRLAARARRLVKRATQRSSSNFKFAFLFLRPAQRRALELVYEFCRVVDDIVDEREPGPEGDAEAAEGLQLWRDEVARIYDPEREPETPLGRGLQETLDEFSYPREGFDEIIEGCAMDLDLAIYQDDESLELYCYRVASCVGLLCIAIFGDQSDAAQRYARHLGLALQYTNILRDVGEDAERGRIYLPQTLLARHGLESADIFAARYDDRFVAAAREFADKAEAEYAAAWAEFADVEHRRALLPAEIMGRTYHEILVEIRESEYNVFVHRPALRRRDKLRVAFMALARTNLPGPATALSSSFSGRAQAG